MLRLDYRGKVRNVPRRPSLEPDRTHGRGYGDEVRGQGPPPILCFRPRGTVGVGGGRSGRGRETQGRSRSPPVSFVSRRDRVRGREGVKDDPFYQMREGTGPSPGPEPQFKEVSKVLVSGTYVSSIWGVEKVKVEKVLKRESKVPTNRVRGEGHHFKIKSLPPFLGYLPSKGTLTARASYYHPISSCLSTIPLPHRHVAYSFSVHLCP